MRVLYIDCFSGISGNMMLGACLELGVPREHIEAAFAALGLPELSLRVAPRDTGNHLFATHVTVMAGDVPADPEDAPPLSPSATSPSVWGGVGLAAAPQTSSPVGGGLAAAPQTSSPVGGGLAAAPQTSSPNQGEVPSAKREAEGAGAHHHHHDDDHHHHHHHDDDHHHHDDDHHDHHHHHDHDHRAYVEIRDMIAASSLADRVKVLAQAMFLRIAEAEAAMHGTTVEEVHFHEVGAFDSIGDIIGAAAALDYLGVERVVCAPLPMGRGFVHSAHGRIPLPAPATARILQGAALVGVDAEFEFVTPTGAAIVMTAADAFGAMPTMQLERVGHGAGTRRLPGGANMLRLFLGTTTTADRAAPGAQPTTRELVELAANIDDMVPEHFGALRERLQEIPGVLDIAWSPRTMKDGRPGVGLEILCTPEAADRARRLVLTESTSLGVRSRRVRRDALERDHLDVDTEYGPISVKLGILGGHIVNLAPEYRVAHAAARAHEVPIKAVYEAAVAAAHKRGVTLGAHWPAAGLAP